MQIKGSKYTIFDTHHVFPIKVYWAECIRTYQDFFLSLGSFPSFKYQMTSLAYSRNSAACTSITFTSGVIDGWVRVFTC
jgi:hypothetical protein